MKLPYSIEAPGQGLKPVSVLVVHQPFQQALLWELAQRWQGLFKDAQTLPFGAESRLKDLLAECGAGSLFAQTRLLRQLRFADPSRWANKETLEGLKKHLAQPHETALLLAVETPRGKAQWLTQLKDVFSKSAHAQLVEIPRLYEREAKTLASRLCGQRGLKPTPAALGAMVRLSDGLADRLVNEIRKLSLYLDGQDPVVKEEVVSAVFDPATEENTFSLLDDLLTGDRLHLKNRLGQFRQQATSFPPPLLLGSFLHLLETLLYTAAAAEGTLRGANTYNQVKTAVETRRQELPARLQGLHPFILSRHLDLVRRLGKPRLVRAALGLHQLDRRLKGAAHSAADPYHLMGEWLSGLMPSNDDQRRAG